MSSKNIWILAILFISTYAQDTDGDGLSDDDEVNIYGTDPALADTDGDGLDDYTEIFTHGTDPLVDDTDGDGLTDGDEIAVYGTNPGLIDTDGDGLDDYSEIFTFGLDPLNPDTDNDGLTDGDEVGVYGTDPLTADTDNDGVIDGDEINDGTDPLDDQDYKTPSPTINPTNNPTIITNQPSVHPTMATNPPTLNPTATTINPSVNPTMSTNNPTSSPTTAFPYCDSSAGCSGNTYHSNETLVECVSYFSCYGSTFHFYEYTTLLCGSQGGRACEYANIYCYKGCNITCIDRTLSCASNNIYFYDNSIMNCLYDGQFGTNKCHQANYYIQSGDVTFNVGGFNNMEGSSFTIENGGSVQVINNGDVNVGSSTYRIGNGGSLFVDCTHGLCQYMNIINRGELKLLAGKNHNTFEGSTTLTFDQANTTIRGCNNTLNICENNIWRLYNESNMQFIDNRNLNPIYLYQQATCTNCLGPVVTSSPTLSPTMNPTATTSSPTMQTDSPTMNPSNNPTMNPSNNPSMMPSSMPSKFPTYTPTGTPTHSPTVAPTLPPTFSPTGTPTRAPTVSPTLPPTFSPTLTPSDSFRCNYTTGDLTVDWDQEFASTSSSVQSSLTSFQNINSDGVLEITVVATADYVVDAMYGDEIVGVTYVLNTEEFTGDTLLGESSDLTCENRYYSDFENLTYNEYWTYTLTPQDNTFPGHDGLGMEYPISDWNLTTISNSACDGIRWRRTFEFSELFFDCGFNFEETDELIQLTGTFYLSLVSPSTLFYDSNDNNTDSGEYFIKQLQAHSITISFTKSYILKTLSESYNLFGVQITGGIFDPELNEFSLILYTYVPNYLTIDGVTSLDALSNDTITWIINEDNSYSPNNCLLRDNYRCWQKFSMSTTIDECVSNGISDIFSILTQLQCYNDSDTSNSESNCQQFIDNSGSMNVDIGSIELDFSVSCDQSVYQENFTDIGNFSLFGNSSFTGSSSSSSSSSSNDSVSTVPVYSPGDTVYVQLALPNVFNSQSLLGLELISSTLCTSDSAALASCDDTDIAIFDIYDIINDESLNYNPIATGNATLTARFSFEVPAISQQYMCIQCTVELTILADDGNVRRLLLTTDVNSFNRFEKYSATARIVQQQTIDITPQNNDKNNENYTQYFFIIGGATLGILIVIGIVSLIYLRKYKNNRMKYQEVAEIQLQNTNSGNIKDEFEGLVE